MIVKKYRNSFNILNICIFHNQIQNIDRNAKATQKEGIENVSKTFIAKVFFSSRFIPLHPFLRKLKDNQTLWKPSEL